MYELAYHMHPNLEEADVTKGMRDIGSLVTKNGGVVVMSHDPKKIRLSYPIDHQRSAYFGVMDFSAPTEMIAEFNAQLKLQGDIMRFLITVKPEGKELRMFGDQRTRKVRTHAVIPRPAPEKSTPAQEQQMEKKLEDVLEKIE